MPRTIVKLTDSTTDTSYYMEWSSVVDAPVTWGMPLDDFKEFIKEQYGRQGLKELPERLERVEQKGTSCYISKDVESIISLNRAGKGGSFLPLDQLIHYYCKIFKNP